MKKVVLFLVALAVCLPNVSYAKGKKPCSGSKGGVKMCTVDGKFMCNDGSISGSKKICGRK